MTLARLTDRCLRILISCQNKEQFKAARKYSALAHKTLKERIHSIAFWAAVYPKIVELEIKFS